MYTMTSVAARADRRHWTSPCLTTRSRQLALRNCTECVHTDLCCSQSCEEPLDQPMPDHQVQAAGPHGDRSLQQVQHQEVVHPASGAHCYQNTGFRYHTINPKNKIYSQWFIFMYKKFNPPPLIFTFFLLYRNKGTDPVHLQDHIRMYENTKY